MHPAVIEKHVNHSATISESERSPLPFPGKIIEGMYEVVSLDLRVPIHRPCSSSHDANAPRSATSRPRNKLPTARLRDLCDDFHPRKTGDRATLTARLTMFSADQVAWAGDYIDPSNAL